MLFRKNLSITDLEDFKLSLMNVSGKPFLARNRRKASISADVDMSDVSSKCAYLVVAHVDNNICDLYICTCLV